jgi:protein-disulfide isomerase
MTVKTKAKNTDRQTQTLLFGVIGLAAVIAVAAIFISGSGIGGALIDIDYSAIPHSRTEDGGFVLGNPEAPVTIIAFEDYLCPHCQAYEPVIRDVIQKYVVTGQAKYEFRILLTQQASQTAAQIAECAEELKPGSYFEGREVLFNITSKEYFDTGSARKFAEEMGLNYGDLLNCTKEADQYQTDVAYATQLGVTGTPSIFIQYGNSTPQKIQTPPDANAYATYISMAGVVQ